MTTISKAAAASLTALDEPTRRLVRISAIVAAGSETEIRDGLSGAESSVPVIWIEELLLQTYLFAGFPRTLNAARIWRAVSGVSAPSVDAEGGGREAFRMAIGNGSLGRSRR